jgi:hypothetical protein
MTRKLFSLVVAFALGLFALAGVRADEPPAAPAQADGADGLKAVWMDILKAAQAGDVDAVRKAFEGMKMAEDDFKALFGDELGAKMAPTYGEGYDKEFLPKAPPDIVAKVKERGYDDVEAYEVTSDPGKQTGNDKKTIEAFKDKAGTKMYSVRLKKKGEDAGFRLDSFFYRNGRWVTGLKIARLLPQS